MRVKFPLMEEKQKFLEEKIDPEQNLSVIIDSHSPASKKEICSYLESQNLRYKLYAQTNIIGLMDFIQKNTLFRLFQLEPYIKSMNID
ncbi:hypothetical protein J4456_01695 [Candidatus Pacearchaeota archaeon]|nr:hypothetical protein [Candidatus Pacearchaeota archaeon]